MKASVFIATSVDGFIARADGGLDWLPEGGEPHGYDEFMATVDALVMGRNTYETVLGFGAWPFTTKPVFVLSSRDVAPAPAGARVPVLLGDGIPLFGGPAQDVVLRHVETRAYPSGLVQSEYAVEAVNAGSRPVFP